MSSSSATIYMQDQLREMVKSHIPVSMSLSKFIQALLIREIVEPADVKKYAEGLHFLDLPHIEKAEFKSLMLARLGSVAPAKKTSPVEPVIPIPAPAEPSTRKPVEPAVKSRRSGVGTGKNQIGY